MREFGAVGECKLDGCTCVTEGKTVMGYFAAVPGGAASPLPAIRRHTGNEDVAPPVWLNAVRSTLQMVWLNPAQSSQSKFQETIVPRVILVSHVTLPYRQVAKHNISTNSR